MGKWGSGCIVQRDLFVFILGAIRQRECRSEEYRQAYVEYQSRPKARVTNHEISYEWKDGEMWLDSRMTLRIGIRKGSQEIVLRPESFVRDLFSKGGR